MPGMEEKSRHDLFCRIPEWVWQALRDEAERENRSATAQLVHLLSKRYKSQCQEHSPRANGQAGQAVNAEA